MVVHRCMSIIGKTYFLMTVVPVYGMRKRTALFSCCTCNQTTDIIPLIQRIAIFFVVWVYIKQLNSIGSVVWVYTIRCCFQQLLYVVWLLRFPLVLLCCLIFVNSIVAEIVHNNCKKLLPNAQLLILCWNDISNKLQ